MPSLVAITPRRVQRAQIRSPTSPAPRAAPRRCAGRAPAPPRSSTSLFESRNGEPRSGTSPCTSCCTRFTKPRARSCGSWNRSRVSSTALHGTPASARMRIASCLVCARVQLRDLLVQRGAVLVAHDPAVEARIVEQVGPVDRRAQRLPHARRRDDHVHVVVRPARARTGTCSASAPRRCRCAAPRRAPIRAVRDARAHEHGHDLLHRDLDELALARRACAARRRR